MRRRIAIIACLLAGGCGGSEFGTDGSGLDAPIGGAAGAAAGAGGSQPYDGGTEPEDASSGGSGGDAGQADADPLDGGEAGAAGQGGTGPDAEADAQPTCSQYEHLCEGTCVQNTPENGCATQCSPCSAPPNAHAVCDLGECAWQCDAGCEDTADGCVCPVHECCDYGECSGNLTCYFGVCQTSPLKCFLDECVSMCVFCLGKPGGFCNSGGTCQCK